MHRSGTSALTAALCACGGTTGNNLLAPMAGVNDDGFWEDKDVVAINDLLFHEYHSEWYTPPINPITETSSAEIVSEARACIARGFGSGVVELIKDPRLCVTLPFWLQRCDESGIPYKVCVITRNILEVARSLTKRDEFPLSYSARLCEEYGRVLASVEEGYGPFVHVKFEDLISDSVACLESVCAQTWPALHMESSAIEAVIKPAYRHQRANDATDSLHGNVIDDLCKSFVLRGQHLTELGLEHKNALQIIGERDQQLQVVHEDYLRLGGEHAYAIGVVVERDEQLQAANERIHQITGELDFYKESVLQATTRLLQLNADLNCEAVEKESKTEVETLFLLLDRTLAMNAELQRELAIHKSWRKKLLNTFKKISGGF
jgi:hypothetical protein